MLTSLMLISFLNTSHAVPLQLTQQGRVLDNNGASVTGAHDLTFRIYDASTGGSVYWSETLTVNFNNGYYAAILGTDEQNNPLDSSTLSLYPLYLEVQLDNNAPMTTRYSINSAPYAQMAGNAEVASSVDGGSVNATEVSINASQVIDGNGNWVGQPITVDWNNIDPNTIPSYIADGDDNTQLSEGQVEGYITNDVINLAAGSQVGGSDIVTVATDSDTLADLSCSTAEIAGWDGSSWVCTSDNTLTVSDVSTMLSNNSVDLNSGTTVGGLAILTEVDDSDTLANLSCANDGEIARYDLLLDEWYCDADIDTVLDEGTVETYVTNGALDLDANTTIGGNPILTTTTDSDVLAGLGCNDGQVAKYDSSNGAWACGSDDNTQLSQSEVINNITGQQVSLGTGSQVGGADILTNPNGCSDAQVLVYDATNSAWVCGDDNDTTLTPTEMQAMIEVMSLNLQNLPQVNGADVLTTGSSIDVTQLDGTSGSIGQVLTTDGSSVSWGSGSSCSLTVVENSQAQLNCGGTIIALDKYTVYSASSPGGYFTCAIKFNDTIECWGVDSHGQVSNAPNGTFTSLNSGENHSCGLDSSGSVQCWGYDYSGQVSNAPSGTFTSISAGVNHTCGLDNGGSIQCWGLNSWGATSTPGGSFIQVTVGASNTCGLDTTGSVQCWGNPHSGINNAPNGTFSYISSGYEFVCGLDSTGSVQCWGNDSHGQVSNAPNGTFTSLTSGGQHVCALDSVGIVSCWGNDYYGQVSNRPSDSDTFTSISSGGHHVCALAASGQLQCWGANTSGQIEVP